MSHQYYFNDWSV